MVNLVCQYFRTLPDCEATCHAPVRQRISSLQSFNVFDWWGDFDGNDGISSPECISCVITDYDGVRVTGFARSLKYSICQDSSLIDEQNTVLVLDGTCSITSFATETPDNLPGQFLLVCQCFGSSLIFETHQNCNFYIFCHLGSGQYSTFTLISLSWSKGYFLPSDATPS